MIKEPQKTDYAALSLDYNLLPVGGVLRIDRLTNIFNLHRAMGTRGLEQNKDYQARTSGEHCIIRKLTKLKMK